jgi:glycosyltransferase involved in cell wall biosynthesis
MNDHLIKVYLTRGHAFGNSKEKKPRKDITPEGVPFRYMGLTVRPKRNLLKLIDDIFSFGYLLIIIPSVILRRKRVTILSYHTDLFHSLLIFSATSLFRIKLITMVPEYFNKAQFKGFGNRLKWYNFIICFNNLNPLSDGLIVFSNYLRKIYFEKGFDSNMIYVQPNLTDFDFWNIPESTIEYTIGYSGTPGKKDGLFDLFAAISLLKDRLPVSLLVIGDSIFGESKIPELKNICKEMEIEDLVFFTGLVEYEEVRNHLSKCKILAITRPKNVQTDAGFPTKLGEYMALRKPVLATDFGEIEKYFTNGKEIVIACCNDPASIAGKILWMIENDDIINNIANGGYQKAYKLLEYSEAMRSIISFIDRI